MAPKCIWLIGNIHSEFDRKTRNERYESLKKFGIKIISKHYFKNVPLIDVIYELLNLSKDEQRVMILHYHDQITNPEQVKIYMNIRQTIIAKPTFYDKTGILEKLDDEYCLSGLITDASKIRAYFAENGPQHESMRYLRWLDMMGYFNQRYGVKDKYILYNLCRRDEEMELGIIESMNEAKQIEYEKKLKQIHISDRIINHAAEKMKELNFIISGKAPDA